MTSPLKSYQLFNFRPERAIRQSIVSVKEWRDKVRINGHHEETREKDKKPGVDEEKLTTSTDDVEQQGQDGKTDQLTHEKLFDFVLGVELK